MPPITFTDANFRSIDPKHDDLMVVTIEVSNFVVMKTLMDKGSFIDILYWKTFRKMGLSQDIRGYIDFDIKFGEGNECCKKSRSDTC